MKHTLPTLLRVLLILVASLFFLRLIETALLWLAMTQVENSKFNMFAAQAGILVLLIPTLFYICKKYKLSSSTFPIKFNIFYLIITLMFLLLLIATPFITGDRSPKIILLLFYGSIATPIFEEYIFRGVCWNQIEQYTHKPIITWLVTSLLFGIWHLGAIYPVSLRIEEGLAHIMFWKVTTGICFGLVLGLVRIKTKNCYSAMLLHGMLNMIAR